MTGADREWLAVYYDDPNNAAAMTGNARGRPSRLEGVARLEPPVTGMPPGLATHATGLVQQVRRLP